MNTLKRFLISSAITFVSTFAVVFFAMVSSETFDFSRDAISSAMVSGVFTAIRAVAKGIVEYANGYLGR